MYVSTSEIVQKANSIVAQCGTRDPLRIARDLGVEVMYYPFNEQRGAYKVLMRNRFIFIKNDLHPVMENIVLLHELGPKKVPDIPLSTLDYFHRRLLKVHPNRHILIKQSVLQEWQICFLPDIF